MIARASRSGRPNKRRVRCVPRLSPTRCSCRSGGPAGRNLDHVLLDLHRHGSEQLRASSRRYRHRWPCGDRWHKVGRCGFERRRSIVNVSHDELRPFPCHRSCRDDGCHDRRWLRGAAFASSLRPLSDSQASTTSICQPTRLGASCVGLGNRPSRTIRSIVQRDTPHAS